MTLEGLCRSVAARSGRGYFASDILPSVMILLVWQRVRRTQVRILALLARFQAGRLRVMPAGGRSAPRTGGGSRGDAPAGKLPRRFAWLLPLVPCEAANFSSQLRHQLGDPEMVALLRASAQARRVLAPVCRMLGIEAELLVPPEVTVSGLAAVTLVAALEVVQEPEGPAGFGDPSGLAGVPKQRLVRSFDRGRRSTIG